MTQRFIGLDPSFVAALKSDLSRSVEPWNCLRHTLREKAEQSMTKGPWTITDNPSLAASGNKHDYYSEGPYWWPDPENPGGPYVRHDGQQYPHHFDHHHKAFGALAHTVTDLCLAGFYLDEPTYLIRAAELARIWFLDPETKMTPHLEFAQAIHGRCTGRGIGIIELRSLDRIIFALGFLDASDVAPTVMTGIKQWVADMLQWMTTSEKGLEAKHHGNNHSSWWAVHVAICAQFIGQSRFLEDMAIFFKQTLLPKQMDACGRFPMELARTKSFSYSLMNLDALAVLCELADLEGIDLWHYTLPDGRGMLQAISFITPFIHHPERWPHEQIDDFVPTDRLALQLAALRLDLPDVAQANQHRRHSRPALMKHLPFGPLELLPGYRP